MTVDCIIEDDRWAEAGLPALAEVACAAALSSRGLDPEDWEIAVLGCDDARIAELNGDFRDKPRATNVLSWPSEERGAEAEGAMPEAPVPGGNPELGDIAISYDTCAAEARAQGKPFDQHVTHLLVHATLHLLGFDHIRDGCAAVMEAAEVEILGKMGLPDPYRDA